MSLTSGVSGRRKRGEERGRRSSVEVGEWRRVKSEATYPHLTQASNTLTLELFGFGVEARRR